MRVASQCLRRKALFTLPALALIAAPLAPSAGAQLPDGLSPQQVQSMIPGEISVPAGQSTTVDVGVPVDVNYSAGGWTVTSSGTSVTVSAPNQPGATASVPASAGGYTATVNLVAVGDGAGETGGGEDQPAPSAQAPGGAASSGAAGSKGNAQPGQLEQPPTGSNGSAEAPAVSHPPRTKAEPADGAAAKKLYFDGEIHGNQIVVKVPLSRVKDLLQYAGYDADGAKLRYLDINGQIIEGVERDIDKASRTLTLTYPDGETPDNPFIMEMVRDGKADFIAVITATNAAVEQPGAEDPANQYGTYAEREDQGGGVDGTTSISNVLPLVIAGAALLAALGLLVALLRRRRGRA